MRAGESRNLVAVVEGNPDPGGAVAAYAGTERVQMRTKSLLFAAFALIATTPLFAQISDTYVVPVVGNTAGDRGTRWATEMHIFNPQPHRLNISIVFVPSGGSQAMEAVVTAEPNMTLFSENLLSDLFGASGTGAVSVAAFPEDNTNLPPNDILKRSFVVGSRIYNNAATGTFGQRVPGALIALMEDDITAIADGIRNSTASDFRTNVGAVNLGRFSVTMYVQVYGPSGNALGSPLQFSLPPLGHAQDRLPVTVDHGSAEFWIDDSDPQRSALVFPYASVIDNRSGDAIYISPTLLAFPSELAPLSEGKRTRELPKISIDTARDVRATAIRAGSFRFEDGAFLRVAR